MKRAIFIILLSPSYLFSQQLSLDFGGLVIHTKYENDTKYAIIPDADRPGRYKTKAVNIPFPRVVLRPQIGISYRAGLKNYYQIGAFTGQDCLNGNIFGAYGELGRSWKYIRSGVIIGGYLRNKTLWKENYFNGNSFVPIIGVDIVFRKQFNRMSIELSNKITPIMTVHNLSLTLEL